MQAPMTGREELDFTLLFVYMPGLRAGQDSSAPRKTFVILTHCDTDILLFCGFSRVGEKAFAKGVSACPRMTTEPSTNSNATPPAS